jgi:hypothetical protein
MKSRSRNLRFHRSTIPPVTHPCRANHGDTPNGAPARGQVTFGQSDSQPIT